MQMKIFDTEDEQKIGQESEEDILAFNKDSLSDAVLWGTDWTTETIISQLKKKNIELSPSFQRRDAWGEDRKSGFIESIILGLPIPQIILAERKDKKGSYLVIDGKQRLLSLRQFCVTEADDEFTALKLKKLAILTGLNNKTYLNIKSEPELSDFHTAFENQAIRTVIIKNWPNQDFLYTVFLRLNTGSLPLSPQELRQALNPGPFTTFADEYSIESARIKQVLKLKKPDYRMRDVEIVARFYAFKNFLERYNGKLKEFLDNTCETLNKEWEKDPQRIKTQSEELEFSIYVTFEIFGENAFTKYANGVFTGIFNRPVYDIMTYFFSNTDIGEAAIGKKQEVYDSFTNLCTNDIDFVRSLETSTKNIDPTAKRFNTWGSELSRITGLKFPIPTRADIGIKFA
jgi:hypothetical protein